MPGLRSDSVLTRNTHRYFAIDRPRHFKDFSSDNVEMGDIGIRDLPSALLS